MALPKNERESNQQEPIYPELKLAIFGGVSCFDSVLKQKKGSKVAYR